MATPSTTFLRLASSLAIASGLWAIPSIARADEVPDLKRGDVILSDVVGIRTSGIGYLGMLSPGGSSMALSGLFGYSISTQSAKGVDQGYEQSREIFSVNPSVDVVVSGRWTLGVSAGFSDTTDAYRYSQAPGPDSRSSQETMTFAFAARGGYVKPLGHGLSLWPRVGIGYSRLKSRNQSTVPGIADGSLQDAQAIFGGADLGLMFRPASFFYVAATPELTVGYYSASATDTTMEHGFSSFRAGFSATLSAGFVL